MGFLKQKIEGSEKFGEIEKASDGVYIWTTNPKLTAYIKDSEVDNEDVAFIIEKTVDYFRKALGIKLSIIERFHVKEITQDTIRRFKHAFGEFPEGMTHFSSSVWQYLAGADIILPDKMHIEIAQRIIFEVYSTPFELMRFHGEAVPRYELDYLARLQHRYNHPFIGEDYQR